MRFRPLALRCVCGVAPEGIKQVGLTAEHRLVMRWRCEACHMEVYVVKDLADCWLECPRPEAVTVAGNLRDEVVRRSDEAFLSSMGVKYS